MRYVLRFFVVLLRKFSRPNPPAKPQISHSAPPLLTQSKILTNLFRTANNLSICKTKIHSNASFASSALANAFISCDRSRLFEQDFPRSGRRVRADRQLPAASSGRFQFHSRATWTRRLFCPVLLAV
ncbi:TPA: hypothetical protein ACSR08_004391 [Enterobacter asburiae]